MTDDLVARLRNEGDDEAVEALRLQEASIRRLVRKLAAAEAKEHKSFQQYVDANEARIEAEARVRELEDRISVLERDLDAQIAGHRLSANEATKHLMRVRELEAERDKWDRRVAYDELKAREHVNRATQQRQIDALTVRAETAERALAEAYKRCAKKARSYDDGRLVYDSQGHTIPSRHGSKIAATIRKLAQEVKHEVE